MLIFHLLILISAVVWENVGIAVYFWPRGSVPADIALGAPRPDKWPLPSARWPSSTCSPDHFVQHVAIMDTTLCVEDRKSTRLNSSHLGISFAVFCLKK